MLRSVPATLVITAIASITSACSSSSRAGTKAIEDGGHEDAPVTAQHDGGTKPVTDAGRHDTGAIVSSPDAETTPPSSDAASSTHDAETTPPSSDASSSNVACGATPPEYTNGNGSVTFYTLSGSGAVNCGYPIVSENPDVITGVYQGAGQYFGAMNTADYNNAAVCGGCVELTRDSTKTVDITIVDQCPTDSNPKCKSGHIDLSEAAFLQLGTADEGYLGTGNGGAVGVISWKYIPCPVTSNVEIQVKDGSNQYFSQLQVLDNRYLISSLEVMQSGAWQQATLLSYDEWQVGNGNIGAGPFDVRVTDINGSEVTGSIKLDPSAPQAMDGQLPTCQ